MSDAIGPLFVDEHASPEIRQKVDAEIGRILKDSRERVMKLLTQKSGDLHKLAAALLEFETLTESEIREVLEGTFKPNKVRLDAGESTGVGPDDST